MGAFCAKLCSPCYLHYKYDMDCDGYKDYDQLLDINVHRKKLNSRTHLDDTRMLTCFAGTLFAACLVDWQFWTTLAIFWLGRYIKSQNFNNLPALCGTALSICASLIIFLLVFYVTTCYNRYTAQYDVAMAIGGRIFDTCTLARSYMSKAASWRIFRLVNSAHLLSYVGLNSAYDEKNLFEPINSKHRLLTPEETARLKEVGLVGGNTHREVIAWALEAVKQEYDDNKITDVQMELFANQLLSLRGSLARLFHFAELPVPFSYVHCINMMVFLFLPLYSYSMAYSYSPPPVAGSKPTVVALYNRNKKNDSIIEFLFVMFFTATCLSLRTLGQKLQDPFGHNLEDLPVLGFITATIMGSGKILCAPNVQLTTLEEEAAMFAQRESFGKQFSFDCGVVGGDTKGKDSKGPAV